MEAATWALVGVTFSLVVLTGWYAYETRRTVRRHQEEIEAMSRPLLAFQLISWQPRLVKLRIQNVGNGIALDVKGEMRTVLRHGGHVSVPWACAGLMAGMYEEFGIPVTSDRSRKFEYQLDEIRTHVTEAVAEFNYRSASGNSYDLRHSIAVADMIDAWVSSRMLVTQDQPERIMPRIAKTLESIDNRLKRLPPRGVEKYDELDETE